MVRKIVIPGSFITDQRRKIGENVFIREGNIYSSILGVADDESETITVIPLKGKYLPKVGDTVIGIVIKEEHSGYLIDINSFYNAFYHYERIKRRLSVGNIVLVTVSEVNEVNEVELSYLKVLFNGEIIVTSPAKIPRIIGKKHSMLNMLKEATNLEIIAGINGRIFAKGAQNDIEILKKAIKKIEECAHLPNLTESIRLFLIEEKGVK